MNEIKSIVQFTVKHSRHTPWHYTFTHSFFWFELELLGQDYKSNWLVGKNCFRTYSFFDEDHLKICPGSAADNYIEFVKRNGVTSKIKSIKLYTQLRFLGYVFNPVSFIILTDENNRKFGIIEIGNTFNELKPFFVPNENFKKVQMEGRDEENINFEILTKKYFYISPFISHDNDLKFKWYQNKDNLAILVDDFKGEVKELSVHLTGKILPTSIKEIIFNSILVPFVTIKTIALIHFHAFVLWFKRLPYFKKHQYIELQQGAFTWKTSKPKSL